MKKTFYPKIFFPSIKLIFIIGSLVFLFFVAFKYFEELKSKNDLDFIFSGLIFTLFIGLFTFIFGYGFCFYFKWVSIFENRISIFELNKLKYTQVDVNEISGYSSSEVYFGKFNWKSKSLVIYFKSGMTSEIVSSFVSGIDDLEKELKSRKVKYLGFEDYKTGLFFRQYKYSNK